MEFFERLSYNAGLLVSKGDTLASVVRRHASTIIFFETAGEIYFKFGL
jgi:hypothetical protein